MTMRTVTLALLCGAATLAAQKPANKKEQPKQVSALDKYIQEASQPATANSQIPANGSLWSPSARFAELASDLRARRVDDIVTIVVQESASATSTGTTKTSRTSSAQSNIAALGGITRAARTACQSRQTREFDSGRRGSHQPPDHLDDHG